MLFSLPLLVTFLSVSTATAASCSKSTGISPKEAKATTRKFKQGSIAPGVVAAGTVKPKVDVNIVYGKKAVKLGNVFNSRETNDKPAMSFTREEKIPPSRNYTFMMLDPDAPKPNDPPTTVASSGFYLHMLKLNVHPNCAKKLAGGEKTIAPYASPAPPSVARHRYIFLVYRQPLGKLKYSQQPALKNRSNFNLKKFVRESGIELVGGNYFRQGSTDIA